MRRQIERDAEIRAAAAAEVSELEREHDGSPGPFDYEGWAQTIERHLADDPRALRFDPQEPEYWRAVIAELRRRGTK